MSVDAVWRERHPVRWLAAAPLWSSLLDTPEAGADDVDRMQRPTLLRMTSDDFMDDLGAVLADDPVRLREYEAGLTSFRAAPPGAQPGYQAAIDHVKLYQPVHGHFNLVAATLICRVAGLPDKDVDVAAEETMSFVMRRVGGDGELAWTEAGWVEVEHPNSLAEGEQLNAMFPVPYAAGERQRRLVVGLVPTASPASARSGGAASFAPDPDGSVEPPDLRLAELDGNVIEPLRAMKINPVPDGLSPAEQANNRASQAALRIEASRFIVLDLAAFLVRHIPQLWGALQARQRPAATGLAGAYDALNSWADNGRRKSWHDALLAVWGERDRIWGETATAPIYDVDLADRGLDPNLLRTRIVGALPTLTAAQRAAAVPPLDVPKLDPRPATRYVIRCVYRRPACGPLHPDVVSEPSAPFAIASFFDLDAPARPIHIVLPIDTTIAGLRKAPKNVRMVISRELHQQMSRVSDLKKVMKDQIDSGEDIDLGVICSFSIPIITICALILLMIFVFILNLVFFWVPFFRICLPIPLKAKN